MKRFTMIVALLLMVAMPMMAQRSAFTKVTPDLQEELDKRSNPNETFNIIITMADEYSQERIVHQAQHMNKEEGRVFVVNELKSFAKASQHDLLQLLNEGGKAEIVKDIKSFWLFNGISCTTNREMIDVLAQRKDIASIDLDKIVLLPDDEKSVEATEATRALAWHVTQVHANEVWDLGYDGSNVIVAIIDTGVNYNHTDLADHMWDGGTEYPLHGYDFYSDDNDPMDENGHGSHCAGITAGDGTSGTQTGIAPNAAIMALKVFGASGGASTDDILDAMSFAVEHGAHIVSMSLGASGDSGHSYYRQAFINMMNANVIASVAAGNDGEKYNTYAVPTNIGSPGNCPSPWPNPDQTLTGGQSAVVTVGASNRNDRKTTFSSFGPVTWGNVSGYADYPYTANSSTEIGLIKPDIIAPGGDINSCDYSSNNGYVVKMGTSMATPLVSGIMALMLNANHNLTPSEIDQILETTTFPSEFQVTKNCYTGAGRADALSAIDAIITQATKPTNLNLTTCGGNVSLNWTESTAPNGYCIYRDNVLVGSTTQTYYTDENVGTGRHVYYVRANDNNNHQSVRSEALHCTINPYATIPENLTIGWDGNSADLEWNASIVSNSTNEAVAGFTGNMNISFVNNSDGNYMFWGIRLLPEELRPYLGMSIDKIIVASRYNREHTLYIYRGTSFGNTTGEAVRTQSFTPSSTNWTTNTVILNDPYFISDISEDLWIVCSTLKVSGTYPAVAGTFNGHASNCLYLTSGNNPNAIIWSSATDSGSHYAATIRAHLTRTTSYTPTYNVYHDNNSEVSNLSINNYTDLTPVLHSSENTYYVTASVGNNESCPSNVAKITLIDNTQSLSDIEINESQVFLVSPTGTITTNGSFISNDPARLIIENGGQFFSSLDGIQATVKKDIDAYTANDNGWYFIASPVTGSITPSAVNGLLTNNYDLYKFDQSQVLEWRNIEANSFSTIDHKTGYLYANSGNTTLSFAGTLAATATATPLAYDANATTLKGFNLIGNPYPCNTTIDIDFYVISGKTVTLAESGRQIAPCEGVFVKATGENESVSFTKTTASAKGTHPKDCFDVVVTQGRSVIDRARVRLGEGIGMEKFNLDDSHTQISLWQDGQQFAVAFANGENEMPLNFKAAKNGSYTLAFEVENLDLGYLHLIDNMTDDEIDVLAMPTYTFEAKTSDYASRFKLVFAEPTDGPSADDQPFAYYANGEIHIVADACDASLQVVDVTGRVVASVGEHTRCVPTAGMVPGVYVLRLISGDNVRTQKIVIE